MRGKNIIKKAIFLAGTIFLLCKGGTALAADQVHTMPAFSGEKASLKILCQYKEEDKNTHIDGVIFEISQVAKVENKNGAVSYTLLDEYEQLKIDFEGMTASQSNIYAKQLADLQEQKSVSGETRITDSNGTAKMDSLDYGIYLIKQVGKKGTAKKFSDYAPFLVLVPGIADDFTWIYHVTVEPKPLVTKNASPSTPKKPEKVNTPKTGDETQLETWIAILRISILGMVCVFIENIVGKNKYNMMGKR